MTRAIKRVSGYNPRFLVWWLEGIRAPTSVTFPTRRIATRIRQDLYNLRKAMQAEGHFAASLVDRGEIIRRPVLPNRTGIEDPHTLTIQPVNFDTNQSLDAAGIQAPSLEEDLLQEPATPTTLNYAEMMHKDTES